MGRFLLISGPWIKFQIFFTEIFFVFLFFYSWFFPKTHFQVWKLENSFCSFPNSSSWQPRKFGVLINNRFLKVSCHTMQLKFGLSPSKKVVFIRFNKNLLKMMKNTSYFILKTFFVLEIFHFLSWLFGYVEKRLNKKSKVNLKIYQVTDCS